MTDSTPATAADMALVGRPIPHTWVEVSTRAGRLCGTCGVGENDHDERQVGVLCPLLIPRVRSSTMPDQPATAALCPQGRTDYEACFAPFRYCPVKGCGRVERQDYGDAFAEAVAASARLGAALAQFDAALNRLGAATTARREAGVPDGT